MRIAPILAAVPLALVLTACAGDDVDCNDPNLSQAEWTEHCAAALEREMDELGEDIEQNMEPHPNEEEQQVSPDANERGNIELDIGERADTGYLTFTVESIELNPTCDETPENGHFLVLHATVDNGDSPVEGGMGSPMQSDGFSMVDSDGVTQSNISTFSAFSCLETSDTLPSGGFDPNQTYEGAVMLDVPESSGTLIHQPVDTAYGWEWQY